MTKHTGAPLKVAIAGCVILAGLVSVLINTTCVESGFSKEVIEKINLHSAIDGHPVMVERVDGILDKLDDLEDGQEAILDKLDEVHD